VLLKAPHPSRAVPVIAAALACATSTAVGALIAQGTSAFRLAAMAAAMLLLPVATFHPDVLAPVFLGLLWARVSDVGIAAQGLPSLAVPFAAALVLLVVGRRLISGERIDATTLRGVFPLLPYFAVVSLSALWAVDPQRTVGGAAELAKNLLIFWVAVELIRSLRVLTACCLALVLSAGALSAISVYQYVTGTFTSDYGGFAQADVRQIVDNVNLYRLAGPIGDPNFYALILLVTVPLGLALLASTRRPFVRLVVASGVVLTAATVLLTYSRGGVIVLAIGCLLSLARLRVDASRVALLVVALSVALALMPPSVWERLGTMLRPIQNTSQVGQVVDTSVELRLGAQRAAIEMFLDHPLGGVGADNYPLLYQEYSQRLGVTAVASQFQPHNLYLQVGAETGMLGLLAFLPAVIGPLVALEQARRAGRGVTPAREWLVVSFGVEIALVCYLLASFTLQGSYPRYLWILLALVVAARRVAPMNARGAAWPT
jgi:putative inorganic carbon (HCO3(-)) transporter